MTDALFAVAWCAWSAVFIFLEGLALLNKRTGDTLSENTRALFRVRTTKTGRAVFTVIWFGFAAWFGLHILTGTM